MSEYDKNYYRHMEIYYKTANEIFLKLKKMEITHLKKVPENWASILSWDYSIDDIDFALKTLASAILEEDSIPLEMVKTPGSLVVKIEKKPNLIQSAA